MKNIYKQMLTGFFAVLTIQFLTGCGPAGGMPSGVSGSSESSYLSTDNLSVASPQAHSPASQVSPAASGTAQGWPSQNVIVRRWSKSFAQSIFFRATAKIPADTVDEGTAFYTFPEPSPSRRKIYSCMQRVQPFSHFLSLDAKCEGQFVGGDLGFVEESQKANTLLLVRCFHPVRGQHLAVTNKNIQECLDQGYRMDGALGWVPQNTSFLFPIKMVQILRGYHPAKQNHTWDHLATFKTLGYQSEGSVFKLFASQAANRKALFLCHVPAPAFNGQGTYFISTLGDCEGAVRIKYLGYANLTATKETPTQLLRCAGGVNGGHLITTDESECTQNGFKIEVLLGYVAL